MSDPPLEEGGAHLLFGEWFGDAEAGGLPVVDVSWICGIPSRALIAGGHVLHFCTRGIAPSVVFRIKQAQE